MRLPGEYSVVLESGTFLHPRTHITHACASFSSLVLGTRMRRQLIFSTASAL
ncbi:uncharacterized protein DS421_19g657240 [Arachis hypogaea]|uniref:Uncharacterized protein n=1 Tax=Arachis hypogaea TaxID=3818 RepID=A0A6B9V861_ARAHY|nr:uncharacterized protein DS421_19g657240 [Arachis hypogaea]